MSVIAFGNFTPDFIDSLASELSGRRVLEIYAGNGYLSAELRKRHVNIRATSLFAGHDGHDSKMWGPVENIEASQAIDAYQHESDCLLVSWPTTTNAMLRAAIAWGREKDIFFIGERLKPELGSFGRFPGCASDEFFARTCIIRTIPGYTPRNMLDDACVMRFLG